MSEAATATRNPQAQAAPQTGGASPVTELKASAHLMTLDTGLFCIFQGPGAAIDARSGLPSVRISLPPNAGSSDTVNISTVRSDGWLNGHDNAALVRVSKGPGQVLVTVYQTPGAPPDAAPRLQVMRLGGEPASGAQSAPAQAGQPTVPM